MDTSRSTTVEEIFTAEAIAKSGTAYSRIIGVTKLAGNASIQLELTGDGTAKVEWVGTNDEDAAVADYIKPNNASDIVTAFTDTSGPGADGIHIYPFEVSLVRNICIKITETTGTDAIAVTAIIAIQ